MELRARAYRLLVRRQGDRAFDFYRPSRPQVRSFLALPLKDTSVAIVTTAGIFHRPSAEPFAVAPGRGDPTFRQLPIGADRRDLSITPGRFDLRAAEIDLDVVYPVQAMRRAQARGAIGGVCGTALSLHGHIPDPEPLLNRTAPVAARQIKQLGAGAAVVIGACALGAQSAGVVALAFETEGLPTVVITQWPRLARQVGASRAQATPFPFGMTMGPPGLEPLHDWVLGRALGQLTPHLRAP